MEEGREIAYTTKQKALVKSHAVEQKIRGVAGSGKTTVLAARAVDACLRTRSRVLVLTFNITLRNYIHDKISEVKKRFGWDKFHIIHYHLFFMIEANNYNLPVNDWEHDTSNVDFFADVEHETVRYDAIFIDEIQDYTTDWIRIVKRYFLTPGGEFVVCGDEKQNVYGRTLDEHRTANTTIPGRWNELTESFRSNSKIINLAFEFQDYFFRDKYDLDTIDIVEQRDLFGETQNVNYIDLPNGASTDQLFEIINGTVERWVIPPNDVVVLSSKVDVLRELDFLFRTKAHEKTTTTFESREEHEQLKTRPGEHEEQRRKSLRRNRKFGFWANSGTVKLATIHSFKGWGAHTLFLIIESQPVQNHVADEEFVSDELIYTAITRCRQNLTIINLGNEKYRQFCLKYMPEESVTAPA